MTVVTHRLRAVLFLSAFLAVPVFLFVASPYVLFLAILPVVLLGLSLKGPSDVVHASLILAVLTILAWFKFMTILVVIPVIYSLLVVMVPRLRKTCSWIRAGHADGVSTLLIVASTIFSPIALVTWFVLTTPDYTDLLNALPHLSFPLLGVLMLVWAGLNAVTEECVYRGFLWQGCAASGVPPLGLMVGQGLHFGVLHYYGFPGGVLGMAMAGIYGIALGGIRVRTRGILWPIVVHFLADVTIGCCYLYVKFALGS